MRKCKKKKNSDIRAAAILGSQKFMYSHFATSFCAFSPRGTWCFPFSHHFPPLWPVFISYMVPLFRASIGWECYAMLTMITVQPNERITSSDKGTREGSDNIVTQLHHNTMTWWQDDVIIWWHDNTRTRYYFRSSNTESEQPLLSCWLPQPPDAFKQWAHWGFFYLIQYEYLYWATNCFHELRVQSCTLYIINISYIWGTIS